VKLRFLLLGLATASVAAGLILWLWKPQDSASPLPAASETESSPLPAASETESSPLPAASEVESMTGHRIAYSPERLPSHILPRADRPEAGELPDFSVPRTHIAKILRTLEPARAIDFEKEGYAPWIIVGQLILSCKGGRSLQVHVYLTPADQPGAFGVFGVDPADKTWGKYRAGSSRQTWGALIDAYVAARPQKDHPE